MNKNIAIVGGDFRVIKLAKLLKKEGFIIHTYGIEKSDEISEDEKEDTLMQSVKDAELIISSTPFTKDGENVYMPFSDKILKIDKFFNNVQSKIIVAGNIKKYSINLQDTKIYDLMESESLTIANAISTAEGAIQIAMEETKITIHNSKILILGFGRIGKILAKDLNALGAKLTCEARKESDISWIKAYGYNALHLKNLDSELDKFDIIFNTIPSLILDKEKLQKINKNCLIIDLASKPGGVDFEECSNLGIKNYWALALPGKVAPETSAIYMKNEIQKILNENCY